MKREFVTNILSVDSAVAEAQEACMTNMGQCCVAGTRTFVHENIYDEFVKRTAQLANNRKVGDPFEPDTINGPQVWLQIIYFFLK